VYKFFSVLFCAFFALPAYSQTEIFKAEIPNAAGSDGYFDASVSIFGNTAVLHANNGMLYGIDLTEGVVKWNRDIQLKSTIPPHSIGVDQAIVHVQRAPVVIRPETGEVTDTIKGLTTINTQPFFYQGKMFATGLTDAGGVVFGYDLERKEISWSKFIGHGISWRPAYYGSNMIVRTDGMDAVWLDYNGRFKYCPFATDTTSVYEVDCIKSVALVAHDDSWVSEFKYRKEFPLLTNPHQLNSTRYTFLANLVDEFLGVMGKRGKKIALVDLRAEIPDDVDYSSLQTHLIRVDGDRVQVFCGGMIFTYDVDEKKIIRKLNINAWDPYRVIAYKDMYLVLSFNGNVYGIR